MLNIDSKDCNGYHRTFTEDTEDAINHYRVFTTEQVIDVLTLLANGKWPNWEFGDAECDLWSAIKRDFVVVERYEPSF